MRTKWVSIILFSVSTLSYSETYNPQDDTINNQYQSVIINPDGTISFCYCGTGKRVSVQSDLFYADEDSICYVDRTRRLKMHKDTDGCFRVKTKPVSPEMYTYCFRIDGKRTPDIMNMDTAWQKMHKWNVISISGSEYSDIYLPPIQQGELIRTRWFSTEEKLYRRVNIYLPAAYSSDSISSFPVLYILHGINGYEGSWAERGRAIPILENLVERGEIAPFILVMPDCNVYPHEDRPSHHTLFNNIMHYSRLVRNHQIEHSISELIQMVDTTYRVSCQNYIAGLSDGARMAANIVNNHPDKFTAIGMFSPVVHKSQLPSAENHNIDYYVYVGKQDMFYFNGKRFSKLLENEISKRNTENDNICYYYSESTGGHNWRNWRRYLADFLRLIAK